MELVILESPYAGEIEKNVEYAQMCMRDCLSRGEAPFASHLLYTQCLDDSEHNERLLGIMAGFAWGKKADKTVVYVDRGISSGMEAGIAQAREAGREIEFRQLF